MCSQNTVVTVNPTTVLSSVPQSVITEDIRVFWGVTLRREGNRYRRLGYVRHGRSV